MEENAVQTISDNASFTYNFTVKSGANEHENNVHTCIAMRGGSMG